ncbi:MAG: peptidase M42 [Anaerolineales bacterium]|nr:peptidase M42 [Anaerolineales bacterium]
MSVPIEINSQYLTDQLITLVNIPSPTGFTLHAIEYAEKTFTELGLQPQKTQKGSLIATIEGEREDRPRAITAHIDTLGTMVKEIKSNGRLRLSKIGNFAWNTVEGECCTIFTKTGDKFRGSMLITKASAHVHGAEVGKLDRSGENMEVRIDERTTSETETRDLGIDVGDFVVFDPRSVVTPTGFIRSRHLDDKTGVACIMASVHAMKNYMISPKQRTTLHISNYEEVGHGAAAGLPTDLCELVAVDMAAVGQGQASDEFHISICAKDSGGPYHFELTRRMQKLAESADIPFKTDVYPHYRSDGETYWRAGGDVQVALIGPGVDASHNYERTHIESLIATSQLIIEYLRD